MSDDIKVGDRVRWLNDEDADTEFKYFGAAIVLAVDGLDVPPPHRASAWIKYDRLRCNEPHLWTYRSVDICDLEKVYG
jgi:hypothetical protein